MTQLGQFARDVAQSGKVEASQIMELRRAIYADGIVSRPEAEVLFEIERKRTAHSDAWSDMFVEALTDYALNREPPAGYLSADTAAWLMAEIGRRKTPSTDAEIEFVTNLVEKAREVPAAFSAFALGLIKTMVMYGGGTDARGRPHHGGRVGEADICTLQRILWGAGSEGLMAVSRDEAEALFAIAHASTGADNDPKFDDLFAKAIGNYLLGATGHAVPAREVSLRWETEAPHRADVLGVLSRTLAGASKAADARFVLDTVMNARSLSDDVEHAIDQDNARRAAATDAAEVVTADKAGWLLDHIGQNGLMTAPEKALVAFVAREASALDPSLKAVLEKVA